MSETPSEALTEYLRDRVGEHLRSVLAYDGDGGELLYVRDDVADQYSEAEIANIVREVRLEAIEKPHQEDLYAHGSMNCTVRSFEDAVEIHLPRDETSGTVVAFDAEVFAIHNTFFGRCVDLLEP